MRLEFLIGGVAATGLSLALAACSADTATVEGSPDADGGTSSSGSSGHSSSTSSSSSSGSTSSSSGSSGSSSGSTSSGGVSSTQVVKGAAVMLGIAGDQIVYLVPAAAGGGALNAVPVAGGAPAKITDLGANDNAVVRGGAVAIYTAATNGVGTIGIWTKANGLKSNVATGSTVGFFTATTDGTTVAFSVGTTSANNKPTSTGVAVTSSANPTNTAVLTGTTAVNLAATNCAPDVSFVGNVLYAAYCTGTTTTTTAARLMKVDGGTATRIDGNKSIQPYWQAAKNGSKLFVIGTAPNNEGRIIDPAGPTVTALENAVEDGVMADDGSAAIYRTTAGALKRGTGAAAATTLVAANVKGFLDFSADKSKVLFYQLDPAGQFQLVDIRLADTTTANQTPTDVVNTATTLPIGFNAPGSQVLWMSDPGQTGLLLKTKPTAGGTEKQLAKDVFGGNPAPSGTSVVLLGNLQQQGQLNLVDLSVVDSVAGGTPAAVANGKSVPDNQIRFKDKTLVFVSVDQTAGGLYTATLP